MHPHISNVRLLLDDFCNPLNQLTRTLQVSRLAPFKVPAAVLFAAVAQYGFSRYLPAKWSVVPLGVAAIVTALASLSESLFPSSNVYEPHVVRGGNLSAQFPEEDGSFSNKPASRSVVVFHVGAQVNHPMGFKAPGAAKVGRNFMMLMQELMKNRDEHGVLGIDKWDGSESTNPNNTLSVMYFKDLESLHKFAHGPLHRKAWDEFDAKTYPHIGIYHETFEVPMGAFETIYLNCRPTLLGAASVPVDGKEGSKQYANTLVSARNSTLKDFYSRLGRDAHGEATVSYY